MLQKLELYRLQVRIKTLAPWRKNSSVEKSSFGASLQKHPKKAEKLLRKRYKTLERCLVYLHVTETS